MNNWNEKNERDGQWERFFDNGQLMYRGRYINGYKIGFWGWYTYIGREIAKEFYL